MPRLCFRGDGSFTIIQFTDTHFINGGEADQRTLALMRAALIWRLEKSLPKHHAL